ncbi:MAG TPA: CBS domain-containing protein [Chitinophagales bacterium]|nr:CBS domain-containing protein [Chitinophagales bacterium]
MIAPHLISDSITPLHPEDSGETALMLMQEFNLSQLPLIEGDKYVGLVTMDEIIGLKHLSHTIKSFQLPLRKPFVLNTAHIFDVMKAAVDFNIKVVPVVDEEGDYMGLISAESCLRAFATLNSVKEPGAIVEVEIPQAEYSLSEVVRLVEENDATITCFYSNLRLDDGMIELTLKLNITEVGPLLAGFQRFEYEVKGVYNDAEYNEELKENYDALMRYLNV